MAGRPKSIDNSKVFDVAKPGKSKPVSTSRPVIVNHSMAVNDASVVNGPGDSTQMQAPSAARKVIKPITISGPEEEKLPVKSSITIIPEPTVEPEVAEPATETAPEAPKEASEAQSSTSSETDSAAEAVVESEPDITVATETAQETDEAPAAEVPTETKSEDATDATSEKPAETEATEPEAAQEPKAEEVTASEPETSDSASVDALAEASEKPKIDPKALEVEAQRDAELQKLIDSKKYVVPLAHDSTKSSGGKGVMIALLIILLLITGVYAAIDAKVLKVDVNLPYHFFKQ